MLLALALFGCDPSPDTGQDTGGGSDTDALLIRRTRIDSASLPIEPGGDVVTEVTVGELQGAVGDTTVLASPDGTEPGFAPLDALVGQALSPGWRYRIEQQARMFDGAALDGFTITYE